MKVLVTGAAGYIGSVLNDVLLNQGFSVRGVDCLLHGKAPVLASWHRPGFEFVKADITNPEVRKQMVQGMDAVVHLAAIVGDPDCKRRPELARAINLDATIGLIDAAREAGVKRFLCFSTCSNYGIAPADRLVSEDAALNPVSLYAETKVAAEKYLLSVGEQTGDEFAGTGLRLSTVYGVSPRMRFDLTVNDFMLGAWRTRKLEVFTPNSWRPYVHLADVALAVRMLLTAPVGVVRNQIFNVGANDENWEKIRIAEAVKALLPDTEIKVVEGGVDPRSYRVDFTKIRRMLGFVPVHGVRSGLAECLKALETGVIDNPDDPLFYNVPVTNRVR